MSTRLQEFYGAKINVKRSHFHNIKVYGYNLYSPKFIDMKYTLRISENFFSNQMCYNGN